MTNHASAMRDLLDEVRGNFTREDDLPDGLLGRICNAIDNYDNRDRTEPPELITKLRTVGNDYDFHQNAIVYQAADQLELLWADREEPHRQAGLYMAECNRLEAERDALRTSQRGVYAQRNELAVAFCKAAIAAGWRAGRGFDDDKSKDWEPEWRHVVYVALPEGQQVSWHIAPTELHLLEGIPEFDGKWDGTFLGRTPGWSTEIEVATVAIDPRWAGVDYEKLNADMRDLLAQVERLRKAQPKYAVRVAPNKDW